MTDFRADPDELLKALKSETSDKTRGRLKIFFGYAAGVGKTYSMLKSARAAKRNGVDVVVGYVEPHARPETMALLDGLEMLPTKIVSYNNIQLKEFDLDAALKRKPKLILVDELAHTNAEGCRHSKRYQDVEELLNAGIDVYTTVNVQHIESLNDLVASVTGVLVRERIPDKIFDNADQVELVDIEPQNLLDRLNEGKIYAGPQAEKALANFFNINNLTALREIALRRCADRINKLTDLERVKNNSDFFTDEHILVCLSASPTNAKIIRAAARMAKAFNGSFTALFVETPDFSVMSDADKNRLRDNIHLAEQLGAAIETVYGEDVPFQIAEFARFSGVSKIVVGRSNAQRRLIISKPTLTDKLIAYCPNLDVYIIPIRQKSVYRARKAKEKIKFVPSDLIKSVIILIAATLLGFIFNAVGFSEANTITVYILGVLFTAIVTTQRIYSLVSSVLSVLMFNFFFTESHFTLLALDSGYPATFLIMFIAAFITSTLAVKLKQHARQSAQTAFRTKVLFDTNQMLQQAKSKENIVSITANQLIKLLDRDIVFYTIENGKLSAPKVFTSSENGEINENYISKNEQAVAAWVMDNNKHAGATTNTLSSAKCLYLAVRVNNAVYGVVGIVMDSSRALDAFENSILLSILGECALALENEKAAKDKEDAAVLAKNEQLRANLLRSISHDLRTPLTAISGNAGVLISNGSMLDDEKKQMLYRDIYDDSLWLINLVENLLSVTRIEDGSMHLKMSAELMDEVITEALKHVDRKITEHKLTVRQPDEYILAKMDARLIVQVIINIVDNAVKYTPSGSSIEISVTKEKGMVAVSISDNGPGIPDADKPRIFDMFYTSGKDIGDSRRSMGLGLALCKSIINAHGGTISVSDNKPHGTVFRFTLPAEEVNLHE